MLFSTRIDELMILDNLTPDARSALKLYPNSVIWATLCVREPPSLWPAALCGPSRSDEMNSSWFQKFKGIIALIVGGAAGVAGGCGGFWWAGAGGIFVKGPWGMYLAAGYFNMAAAGGIAIGAGGAALATGAMAYFVPWDRVFEYLGHTMKWIWARICDGFQWIWKKVMEFASEVVTRASIRKTKKHHQPSWARHEI
jgi:hypothetical protein